MMLEAGAVKVEITKPFFLSSGWASPAYIDCQCLISFPRIRSAVAQFAADSVLTRIGFEQFDAVAGAESTGIAYAAWIADRLSLPLQVVRKHPRGLERSKQVEGVLKPGSRILLIDDVTTDGQSKIALCRVLRELGAHITHVFVVFYYDLYPETRDAFAREGIQLHHLATWQDIYAQQQFKNALAPHEIAEMRAFLDNPAAWSLRNGGIGTLPAST